VLYFEYGIEKLMLIAAVENLEILAVYLIFFLIILFVYFPYQFGIMSMDLT
jgi:hypothetical protein